MTSYTIQIWNQSQAARSYVLFLQQPDLAANAGSPQVYTNAWATFASVTNGGFDRITFDETVYAYWSKAPVGSQALSGGVAQVDTQTTDTVAFSGGSPTGFTTVTSPGSAQPGSFAIVTGSDFTPSNGYVLGMARMGATPIPVPVMTFPALPNMVSSIRPIHTYYVAVGDYQPGEVVDVALASVTAEIDFTGRAQTTATVIQQADGTFSVTYS
ncbi:hypothetical protein [Caulobacter endophyticus]|uniref:Uncharacterized protein n=1 Tax=Caulobacter endophyticus TaxID=2172652 RepID=A0A2T9K5N8_9CAUL|nr:hypothetical protein [Caulobacter endophyticus]PVM91292.1 hypothetical protein DDF67_07345 [Caulobacter endophyticus]